MPSCCVVVTALKGFGRDRLGRFGQAATIGLVAGGALASLIATMRSHLSAPEYFGLDLTAYLEAGRRLAATGSPYSDALRAGPIEHGLANMDAAYRYPPPLAQAFQVLVDVPFPALVMSWALAQAIVLVWLVIVVHQHHGGASTRLAQLLLVTAALAFQPTLAALYSGNVSAWVAALTAIALIAQPSGRALAVSSVAWLKVTPGPLALGAVIDGTTRRKAILILTSIPVVSYTLAPAAWIDYMRLLPNLVRTHAADFSTNLSPSYILASLGWEALASSAALVLPAGFLALTIWSAWRGRRLGWVAAASGAYLTATATSWNHYFVILVPVAVAVWPGAGQGLRRLMIATLLWYGPFWVLAETPWHRVLGIFLWVSCLVWVSVRSESELALNDRPSQARTLRLHSARA